MQVISAAWRGSQGGTGIPDWFPHLRDEGGYAGKILEWGNRNPEWYTNLAENFKQILSGGLTGKSVEDKYTGYSLRKICKHDDLNCCWRIGHHCHRVAKTIRSDRTIFCKPEVKSHQMKEGWLPDQYRKNQNDCQFEGGTIKKGKVVDQALQSVERIFYLPTIKRRDFPFF